MRGAAPQAYLLFAVVCLWNTAAAVLSESQPSLIAEEAPKRLIREERREGASAAGPERRGEHRGGRNDDDRYRAAVSSNGEASRSADEEQAGLGKEREPMDEMRERLMKGMQKSAGHSPEDDQEPFVGALEVAGAHGAADGDEAKVETSENELLNMPRSREAAGMAEASTDAEESENRAATSAGSSGNAVAQYAEEVCPWFWDPPIHTNSDTMVCYNGNCKPATDDLGWSCCAKLGGTFQCPKAKPYMCKAQDNNGDYTCEETAAACVDRHGGRRPCEGPPGSTGPAGPVGDKGAIGKTGEAGPAGVNGTAGKEGAAGPVGQPGVMLGVMPDNAATWGQVAGVTVANACLAVILLFCLRSQPIGQNAKAEPPGEAVDAFLEEKQFEDAGYTAEGVDEQLQANADAMQAAYAAFEDEQEQR